DFSGDVPNHVAPVLRVVRSVTTCHRSLPPFPLVGHQILVMAGAVSPLREALRASTLTAAARPTTPSNHCPTRRRAAAGIRLRTREGVRRSARSTAQGMTKRMIFVEVLSGTC